MIFLIKVSRLLRKICDTSGDEFVFRISRKIRQVVDCHSKTQLCIPEQIKEIIHLNYSQTDLSPEDYKRKWDEKKLFYFSQEDRDSIATYLHAHHPQKIELLREKASSISNLEIPIFNAKFSYTGKIAWNRDPVTKKKWSLVHWSKIKVVDTDAGVDPKFVWELNRHQFFLTPAMLFFITQEEENAEFTVVQICDWIERNPVDHGINWVESLEVGTRLISWIWILELLRGSSALTPDRLAVVVSAMHRHAKHLSHYLSHYISPNTHLTGEALALFLYSAIYPEDKHAGEWELAAKNVLDEEIVLQVGDDGVHRELSTAYHTYTVDYYIQYIALCLHQNKTVNPVVLSQTEKMCEFILFAERPDGSVPLIGDSDGGNALPLDPDESVSWKHLLCDAALLFNRHDFKYRSPVLCWETVWIFGKTSMSSFLEIPKKEPQFKSNHFVNSNYIIYRSDWSDTADYLFFDVGKMGFFSAGHSHADYLNFDLSFSGVPYICDVGTFSYHDSFWRTYGRGTRAHNTVLIDGADQATPRGSFSWASSLEKGTGGLWSCNELTLIQGSHEAYPEISHTRTFLIFKNSFMVCFDEMLTDEQHSYEFNLHFGDTVSMSLYGKEVDAVKSDSKGLWIVPFLFESPEVSQHIGCSASGRGYYFPSYGDKIPINTLSIVEDNCGNLMRGMVFQPYSNKSEKEGFRKTRFSDGAQYSLVSNNVRYLISLNIQGRAVGFTKDFVIDCDYFVEKITNEHEKTFFAVGVSSFQYKGLHVFLMGNKLTYLVIEENQMQVDIYFTECDQLEIVQPFANLVFHSMPKT